ncbi:hypothetical protein LTR43_011640 [Exophiala xenobiotica]|nr:hypothetical protein LTR14_011518 [Exophiala xenobiotica]
MFTKLFRRRGYEYDNVFDWTIREFLKLEPDAKEPLALKDVNERRDEDATKPLGDAVRNAT